MTLSIVPQSLNDYRVHLSSGSSSLDYDWICSILENTNKYDGYILVYMVLAISDLNRAALPFRWIWYQMF